MDDHIKSPPAKIDQDVQTSNVKKDQGTSALHDSGRFSNKAFLNKSSAEVSATVNDYNADRSHSSSFHG